MPVVTLYHATSAPGLKAFDAGSVGLGGDANSALGVHLAERPEDTLRYVTDRNGNPVSRHSRVLVVEADVSRAMVLSHSCDFFGIDEEGNQVREAGEFAERREALMAEGWHAVCTDSGMFDDDGSGVWVVLDPSRLRVVGSMTLDEARESDACADYGGVEMTGGDVFPDTVPGPSPGP